MEGKQMSVSVNKPELNKDSVENIKRQLGPGQVKYSPTVLKNAFRIIIDELKDLPEEELVSTLVKLGNSIKAEQSKVVPSFNSTKENVYTAEEGGYTVKECPRGGICTIVDGKLYRYKGVSVPGVETDEDGRILLSEKEGESK